MVTVADYTVDVAPTVWDILTAIGTVGATVVAVALAWMEVRARKRAEGELAELRREKREAQARRVTVTGVLNLPPRPHKRDVLFQVNTTNSSDRPIFAVTPSVTLTTSKNETIEGTGKYEKSIGARSDRDSMIEIHLHTHDITDIHTEVQFRDADGRNWKRDDDGVLTRWDTLDEDDNEDKDEDEPTGWPARLLRRKSRDT